jgi:hypothetical protein
MVDITPVSTDCLNKGWNAGPNSTAHSLSKRPGMFSLSGNLLALDFKNWFGHPM